MAAPLEKSIAMYSSPSENTSGEKGQPETSTLEESKAKAPLAEKSRSEKTTCISIIPPEILIQIYSHLRAASEITTLNSTSRLLYQIWYENAATISGAVLSRSIDCYDSLLELLELEKYKRTIDWATWETSMILNALQEAQKQARDHVSEARLKGYRGSTSSRQLFREVLNQNANIIAKSQMASQLCNAYEQGAGQKRQREDVYGSSRLIGRKNIIAAYYGVWIMATLSWRRTQTERLLASSKQEFDAMTEMAIFLIVDCSNAQKRALGIVLRELWKHPLNTRMYGSLLCHYDLGWHKALVGICDLSGYGAVARLVRVILGDHRRWR